ncbi:MAG: hypothetical protein NVV82_00600 [Sporocytophaga sp.]|nr:hypothetical protein [Sporocytophaga sp.]
MLQETNFLSKDIIELSSKILGCNFIISFKKEKELLFAAETFLAFFESFLATSNTTIFPSSESIKIQFIKNEKISQIKYYKIEESFEYIFEFNRVDFLNDSKEICWKNMLAFLSEILTKNFVVENIEEFIENLFKKEEFQERSSIILEHRNFMLNVLGVKAKVFYSDWLSGKSFNNYVMKRKDFIVPPNSKSQNKSDSMSDDILNPEKVGHDKRNVFSIIDNELWDSARWKGFGYFTHLSVLGIFLLFDDETSCKKIFDGWIKRMGREDKNEEIKVTIVKGINFKNPYGYRVQVTSNLDIKSPKSGELFTLSSRFHEMAPNSSENLDMLISRYNNFKCYQFCPAILLDGKMIPLMDKSITKKQLFVKSAWEIDENDLERVLIMEGDCPVIPENVIDPPLLKWFKNSKK